MYKQFKEKSNRSVYLPIELIAMIEERAARSISCFNKVVVEVLLKEFLFTEKKSQRTSNK